MKNAFMLLILFTFFVFNAHAAPSPQSALDQLKSAPFITLEVNKNVKSELMGSETNSPGKIYLASERFRWDSEGKESSSLIYDGFYLWTIQQPPKGFKMLPQITKTKMGPNSDNQLLLKSLLQNKIENQFKITKTVKEKNGTRFFLKPTEKNQITHSLELFVKNDDVVSEISYLDEIENRITVTINKIIKAKKVPSQIFKFSPPKGAQVSEI
jgi:outer membrane lipoprotein carrier protein